MARYATLAQAIQLSGLKLQSVATACGINRVTLRSKLAGQHDWKLGELVALQRILRIPDPDFWQLVETEWRSRHSAGKEI